MKYFEILLNLRIYIQSIYFILLLLAVLLVSSKTLTWSWESTWNQLGINLESTWNQLGINLRIKGINLRIKGINKKFDRIQVQESTWESSGIKGINWESTENQLGINKNLGRNPYEGINRNQLGIKRINYYYCKWSAL